MSALAAKLGDAPAAEQRKVVLVVDDNELVRRLIADFVAEMGYLPVEAASAEAALDILAQTRPSVVLMDIVMPGMNGMDALARIRSDARTKDQKVVAVTTLAGGPGEADFLAAGFDGYLPKPLDLKRFADVLKQAMT